MKTRTHRASRKQLLGSLRFEQLEDRRMLATFLVDSLNDFGPGSLRQAILDANAISGPDRIEFAIAGGGPQVIQPLSELPTVSESVTIDGTSQPGYIGVPLIELRGDLATHADGLVVQGEGSIIRGLSINRFSSDGGEAQVILSGSGGHALEGNYIGVDLSGNSSPLANNTMDYAVIISSPNNRIGVDSDGINDAAEGNVIALPASTALILIQNSAADNSVIAGNHLGVNEAGTALLGSAYLGIWLNGNHVSGTRIGTNGDGASDVLERNLIAPNNSFASIQVDGAVGTVIAGNFIGVDISGTQSLGLVGGSVILAEGATHTRIGTNADGDQDDVERNIISGLGGDGINLTEGAANNTIAGNFIGVDVTGTLPIPNAGSGILLHDGASNNTIGGSDLGAGNVISSNHTNVAIDGVASTGNVIQGNTIGADVSGNVALNQGDQFSSGIRIQNSGGNQVGGSTPGAGNQVVGGSNNIQLMGSAAVGNVIQGNFIGVNREGSAAITPDWFTDGPSERGILLHVGAGQTTIGGVNPGEGNVIAGHFGSAIDIYGSGGNLIAGNQIGTNAVGEARIGNGGGVSLNDSPGNDLFGNVISGNGSGVVVVGALSTGTMIRGNRIGTNLAGTVAIPNQDSGINFLSAPESAVIGGTAETDRNIVSANGGDGIRLEGRNHQVLGNFIGTDITGTYALGNGAAGVYVAGATDVRIGSGVAGAGNLVSGNVVGVVVFGVGNSTDARIQGNRIGTTADGLLPLGNLIGVSISGPSNNIVGTNGDGVADALEGNLISGNASGAIKVFAEGTENNVIAGNWIGLDATGLAAIAGSRGVEIINGAARNLIGTNADGVSDDLERNVIAGNMGAGLYLENTFENVIAGNFVGTNQLGTAAISNEGGITIAKSPGNVVGGGNSATRNVISGNRANGIIIGGEESTNNRIVGNYIGTDVSGTLDVGNSDQGIFVTNGASLTQIGGVTEQERNVVSGNNKTGIFLDGIDTTANIITGNFIGLDKTGTIRIDNVDGIAISNASGNRIGGLGADQRNIISGNSRYGMILSSLQGNSVQGNFIGTDYTGDNFAGVNNAHGILVDGDRGSVIGGANFSAANVIVGGGYGIWLGGTSRSTEDIQIQGNFIGTNAEGIEARGNGWGIYIEGQDGHQARNIQIGDNEPGAGNLISGNQFGVFARGAGAQGVIIQGNYIGTDLNGTAALPNSEGVYIQNASGVAIGGEDSGARNVIAGNSVNVRLIGEGTMNTLVQGNLIGLDVSGTRAVTNGWLTGSNDDGIVIESGAHHNRIGGSLPGSGNVIGGHWEQGIWIVGGLGGNVIEGNRIGTNAGGDTSVANIRAILIQNSPDTLVSGNLLSGNYRGIEALGASSGLVIYGNRIGTDADGTEAVPNSTGIHIEDLVGVTIGGTGVGEGNLISGNSGTGISLYRSDAASIQGNLIGTDFTGTNALVPEWGAGFGMGWGIYAVDTSDLLIGGSEETAGNVISGEVAAVIIHGLASRNNRVQGNYVGTNSDGTAVLANQSGINVGYGASLNFIGTDGDGVNDDREGNLISGNPQGGVYLYANPQNNVIAGNLIGTDWTGTSALASPGGIVMYSSASRNRIGTNADGISDELERNIIAGGISLSVDDRDTNGMIGNVIAGNYIGTNITGTVAFGVGQRGIGLGVVRNGEAPGATGPVGTIIGGTSEVERNVIAGFSEAGISADATVGTIIKGNYIGKIGRAHV